LKPLRVVRAVRACTWYGTPLTVLMGVRDVLYIMTRAFSG